MRTETHTLELKPGGQLRALTFNGSIRAEGCERDEVSLVAEIRERREGDIRFSAASKGGYVEIIAEEKNKNVVFAGFGNSESNGVSYTLKIPKNTIATLVSSNGNLEIREVDGEIDTTTSNGSIAAIEIGGKARLSTSNGAIMASTIKGGLIAKTSNGRLDIRDIKGDADLRSSNGRIEVRGVRGETSAFTSNGSIVAEDIEKDLIGKSSNGRIDIDRVLGGIDVCTSNASIIATNLDGRGRGIRLATSNGSIDVALGQAQGQLEACASNRERGVSIQIPNVQPTRDGSTTKAKIGNSDQLIELKTTTGKITVR
jgi:DUF4097 and DUF4098 domain-containing protein YvlB